MNIVILMAIGCQNLGDELILKNQINILREKYKTKNPKFQVFTYDINDIFLNGEDITYFEYFPIGIKKISNIYKNIVNLLTFLKVIKNASKVVFGGGGIIFDNETTNYSNPLHQILFRVKLSNLFKKDIIFYGISIDIKDKNNFKTIKNIFKMSKEIYVRDKNSQDFLNDLGFCSEIILDPVFYDNGNLGLENYKKNYLKEQFLPKDFDIKVLEKYDFENKSVGIAFRSGYLGCDETEEKQIILDIIKQIISKKGKVVLLPHSFHKIDFKANDYEFLKQFVGKDIIISKNMQETYEFYKQKKIDFCLSLRLHSMILSQVYAIDFIAIKYAKKTGLILIR